MESVIRQFDPHFTFNVLSSVGSLIMSGEKELAYDYLIKFSALLRSLLTEGSVIIKPISEELDFVRQYCEVQKLRFGERFNWSIVVNDNVNIARKVPKLTIQIFVENAIKHGLERKKEGGKIEVILSNKDSCMEIRIIDNGIGREASRRQNTRGTGNGLKILTGLFENIDNGNKERATIELIDLFDDLNQPCGTEAKIIVPEDYHFAFDESN
jgi:sensor histidine kinase YesM